MILRLTKQFDFQMAHALSGYDGKCSNIHGHNYKLLVTVEGKPSDNNSSPKKGMVIDFSDIKRIVQQNVIEPFDHAFVVADDSPFAHIPETKIVKVPFQPTSENMLIHFAELLEGTFPPGVSLHSLRIYETETSFAELFL